MRLTGLIDRGCSGKPKTADDRGQGGQGVLERFTDWLENGPLKGKAKCLLADAVFLTVGRALAHTRRPASLPAWEGMHANAAVANASVVALTTACPRYFETFHQALLHSAQRHSQKTLLHFHIIGVTGEEAERIWQDLHSRAGDQPVALSWQAGLAGVPENARAAYYQNARYLLATQVLDTWHRPVVVMDIDVELLAPLERALALAGDSDVCLTFRPRECPSRRYLAGFSLFADTPEARDFLRIYESLFLRYSGLLFFPKFDQRLLYLCTHRDSPARVGTFPTGVIVSERGVRPDLGLVYYPKGAAKWQQTAC